jgi:hypothetical protein
MIQIPLVRRNILDSDDALVELDFGNPIHEKERIAVRQNLLDGRMVERQRQRFHRLILLQYGLRTPGSRLRAYLARSRKSEARSLLRV